MKLSTSVVLATAGLALAAPLDHVGISTPSRSVLSSPEAQLVRRQKGGGAGGATRDELLQGSCKRITLIFARASTEPGNMGTSMGARTCSGLKKAYNNDVACQGVGNPGGKGYTAGLGDNVSPKGTSSNAIAEATKMFTTADSKCPNSILVAGGYSQGTAVMLNTIQALPPKIKNKLVGVVLFGYTKNGQQNPASKSNKKGEIRGGIPNFPKENVAVYCAESDGVCWGQLNVTGGHFSYMANGDEAKSLAFLKSKIDKAKAGGSSSSSSSEGGDEAPAAEAPPAKSKGKAAKGGKGKSSPAPAAEAAPAADSAE